MGEDGFAFLRKSHGGCGQYTTGEDGFDLHLLPEGANECVAAVETGGKQQSTGLFAWTGLSNPSPKQNRDTPEGVSLFWHVWSK